MNSSWKRRCLTLQCVEFIRTGEFFQLLRKSCCQSFSQPNLVVDLLPKHVLNQNLVVELIPIIVPNKLDGALVEQADQTKPTDWLTEIAVPITCYHQKRYWQHQFVLLPKLLPLWEIMLSTIPIWCIVAKLSWNVWTLIKWKRKFDWILGRRVASYGVGETFPAHYDQVNLIKMMYIIK